MHRQSHDHDMQYTCMYSQENPGFKLIDVCGRRVEMLNEGGVSCSVEPLDPNLPKRSRY